MNDKQKVLKVKRYSLWLMPEGETYNKFKNLINKLGAEYKSPLFEPHVTLLGGIVQSEEDVMRGSQRLALGQIPFSINLTAVDYQDFYFRTLFVKAEKNQPLLALHNRAKKISKM